MIVRKHTRHLKVYSRFQKSKWMSKTVPEITLKGEWLRAQGFEEGQQIIVEQKKGYLVIRHDCENESTLLNE